jgi:hypothetical protein
LGSTETPLANASDLSALERNESSGTNPVSKINLFDTNRDNLNEGVLIPDIHDPTVNPLYRDVLCHCGVVALPCRIQDPDR